MAAKETISVNEMYKQLDMPYDAVDNDQYWPHLVRIIEELVRREGLQVQLIDKNRELIENVAKQIELIREVLAI